MARRRDPHLRILLLPLFVMTIAACAAGPFPLEHAASGDRRPRGPVQEAKEPVETGADPSVLLLRFDYSPRFVEQPGRGRLLQNSFKLDVPVTASAGVALEVPVVRARTPDPADDAAGLGDSFLSGRRVWDVGTGSILAGLELGLDTATEDALGSGKWQLNPSAAYVHRFTPEWLLTVGWRQRLSIAGDDDRPDINRSEPRLIGIYLHPKGRWLLLDYRPRIDWTDHGRWTQVLEAEAGVMFSRTLGMSLRPGIGFAEGRDRVYSVQMGVRVFF